MTKTDKQINNLNQNIQRRRRCPVSHDENEGKRPANTNPSKDFSGGEAWGQTRVEPVKMTYITQKRF